MSKNSYLKGAAILSVGAILAKFLGIFFKIPLAHIVGDVGLGLYAYPYPIYNFFLAISVIGLPVAISKMVSERAALGNYRESHRVFKIALVLLIIIGGVSSLLLYSLRNVIISVLNWHPDTYYALIGISFAPFFVSLMSAFRGYFQGLQVMTPTAVSQIIESIGRVIGGLGLSVLLVNLYGIPQAAGGASFGATAGAMAGSAFLVFLYISKRKNIQRRIDRSPKGKTESTQMILKQLLAISIPACISATVTSLMGIIDTSMVPARLAQAGFTMNESAALFGQMTQKAQTLVNVPLTLSTALSASLVPAISEVVALRDRKELQSRVELGIRSVLLIALPAAVGLSLLSGPIIRLLFGDSDGGNILAILSYSVIFVMLTATLQSILQGLNQMIIPIKNLLIGAMVKVIANYILVAIPRINIQGAAIGSIIAYAVAAFLNYRSVVKYTKTKTHIGQTVIKPVIAVCIMGVVVSIVYYSIYELLGNSIATLLSIGLGGIVYFFVLLLIGGITSQEMEVIPGGNRLTPILKKIGFLRREKK
ncbi:putative polysaccharide biosynthesis protein [Garciella nitratireducens]|uniref:Stage V sporulation protein B n=1 Tax=Garciella nitratireducens DSM 15102 TaxID=1121911 RepID=A0A1T4L4J9_9FIRM|nr:polysaccharide biosynthesis protein [Garciella nitratireducens]RBP35557.1 stage V sporulation protein B [Garciella nitratireducens]SJZ49636.1 stage V sporulation protein B [Garciella nitratireducens DSM 15102]